MPEPTPSPQIDPRAAEVAVLLLDTRVNGRYIDRATWRRLPVPIDASARRVAFRLTEVCAQAVSGPEVQAAQRLLRTTTPSHVIRAAVPPKEI